MASANQNGQCRYIWNVPIIGKSYWRASVWITGRITVDRKRDVSPLYQREGWTQLQMESGSLSWQQRVRELLPHGLRYSWGWGAVLKLWEGWRWFESHYGVWRIALSLLGKFRGPSWGWWPWTVRQPSARQMRRQTRELRSAAENDWVNGTQNLSQTGREMKTEGCGQAGSEETVNGGSSWATNKHTRKGFVGEAGMLKEVTSGGRFFWVLVRFTV